MNRFLLDTSVILDILQQNPRGVQAVNAAKGEYATSIICYCEVLNKAPTQKYAKAKEFLSKMMIFAVTVADGMLAEEIQQSCSNRGGHVPTIDCLIAATAVNNNATVLTSDSDFERIQEIKKIVFR